MGGILLEKNARGSPAGSVLQQKRPMDKRRETVASPRARLAAGRSQCAVFARANMGRKNGRHGDFRQDQMGEGAHGQTAGTDPNLVGDWQRALTYFSCTSCPPHTSLDHDRHGKGPCLILGCSCKAMAKGEVFVKPYRERLSYEAAKKAAGKQRESSVKIEKKRGE